jgi:hypothetical protein
MILPMVGPLSRGPASGDETMRKFAALTVAALIGVGALTATGAEARGGGAVAAGLIGGLAAGALLGAAVSEAHAGPAYGYAPPPPPVYRPAPVVYGEPVPVYRPRPVVEEEVVTVYRPRRVVRFEDDGFGPPAHPYGGWRRW